MVTSVTSAGVAEDWCAVCGTRHAKVRCLGEILATEPERHVWRNTFVTPNGRRETIGVILAPCDRGWRARVLTYPRRLWTVPGTTCTVKFVGEVPEEAERKAIDFIEEHCRSRGYRIAADSAPGTAVGRFPPEQTAHAEGLEASRRCLCEIPARFALDDGPVVDGTVVLASERGLFVATDDSAPLGASIRVQAVLDGISVAMNGVVQTVRTSGRVSPGRPAGLGVRLTDPPARYLSYVRRLA